MHVYRELTEPTTVTHSVACNLDTGDDLENLVVMRGSSLLQVFAIGVQERADTGDARFLEREAVVPDTNDGDSFAGPAMAIERVRKRNFLLFVAQFPLDGTVVAIDRIRLPSHAHDVIVLVCRYAKLVLLAWNPAKLVFEPLSLHYYEKELSQHHFVDDAFPVKFAVDPNSRCLTLMYQRDMLAMLAFAAESEEEPDFFSPSFVLRTTDLDPACQNVVDIAYLYAYKEPTLAILFQQPRRTWTGSLPRCKDNVSLLALSIDLERRCSTPIIALQGLPYDLKKVCVLPDPVRGCLLVGANTLVYVDPSGRQFATAVNGYADLTSMVPMQDRRELDVSLDGSQFSLLPDSKIAVGTLASGDLLIVRFQVEGTRVFGYTLDLCSNDYRLLSPSCISVCRSALFIGSLSSHAILLNWETGKHQELASDRIEIETDELDDIYSSLPGDVPDNIEFSLDDVLVSVGPIESLATYRGPNDGENKEVDTAIIGSVGSGQSGSLVVFHRTLKPLIRGRESLDGFTNIWAVDSILLATNTTSSALFRGPDYQPIKAKEFVHNYETLAMAALGDRMFIQVHASGIEVYAMDLKHLKRHRFSKSIKAACVEKDHALVADGVLLVLYELTHSDKGVCISKVAEAKLSTLTISLHDGKIAIARRCHVGWTTLSKFPEFTWYDFALLSACIEGASELQQAPDMGALQTEVTHLNLCQIGDACYGEKVLCIVVDGMFATYQRRHGRFVKTFARPTSTDAKLVPILVGNYNALVSTGRNPLLYVKSAKSPLRCHPIGTRKLSSIASNGLDLLLLDSRGRLKIGGFDADLDITSNVWVFRKLTLGYTITAVTYLESSNVVVLGVNREVPREQVDESEQGERAPDEPAPNGTAELRHRNGGTTYKGYIEIVSPHTWSVLESVPLHSNESLVCLKSVRLEIAQDTDYFKEFLAVGTAVILDEDNVSNGSLVLYSVVDIVPELGTSESQKKLKEVHRELVRGAVTAVCEVMGQLAVGQGQKVLLRSVQEDHTIEPIAFLDTCFYVSDLKSIRNLVIVSDLFRSTWLTSYCAEPHNLYLVAKDYDRRLRVASSDFVSSEERADLFLVIGDAEGRIRLDQFDPDNAGSQGGTKLIVQAEMYVGRVINSMVMVYGLGEDLVTVAGCNDGTLASVYPVDETDYKALFVVTQQMVDKEQPTACLNPRMHRSMGCSVGSQPIIDFKIAHTFWMLDRERQRFYSRKLGRNGLAQMHKALTLTPFDCM